MKARTPHLEAQHTRATFQAYLRAIRVLDGMNRTIDSLPDNAALVARILALMREVHKLGGELLNGKENTQ